MVFFAAGRAGDFREVDPPPAGLEGGGIRGARCMSVWQSKEGGALDESTTIHLEFATTCYILKKGGGSDDSIKELYPTLVFKKSNNY